MLDPHLIAMHLSYILMVWFFFLCVINFTSKEVAVSSFVLMVVWCSYSYYMLFEKYTLFDFTEELELAILFDGATALAMTTILNKDKLAWKYALILSFAVLCHIMILLAIENKERGFFYHYYDELIILTCLMQISVSFNGMVKNSRRCLRNMLRRRNVHYHSADQSRFKHQNKKVKP